MILYLFYISLKRKQAQVLVYMFIFRYGRLRNERCYSQNIIYLIFIVIERYLLGLSFLWISSPSSRPVKVFLVDILIGQVFNSILSLEGVSWSQCHQLTLETSQLLLLSCSGRWSQQGYLLQSSFLQRELLVCKKSDACLVVYCHSLQNTSVSWIQPQQWLKRALGLIPGLGVSWDMINQPNLETLKMLTGKNKYSRPAYLNQLSMSQGPIA